MKPSDFASLVHRESLASTIGPEAFGDCMVEVTCIVKRYLREHDQRVLDAEAARLLHIGAGLLADRFGCHRATVYRRAERARELVALNQRDATKPA